MGEQHWNEEIDRNGFPIAKVKALPGKALAKEERSGVAAMPTEPRPDKPINLLDAMARAHPGVPMEILLRSAEDAGFI